MLAEALTIAGATLLLTGAHPAWGVALTVFSVLLRAWSWTGGRGRAWATLGLTLFVLAGGLVLHPIGNGFVHVLQGSPPPWERLGNPLGVAGFLLLLWVLQASASWRDARFNPGGMQDLAWLEASLRAGLLLMLAVAALALAEHLLV